MLILYSTIVPGWPGTDDNVIRAVRSHPDGLKGLTIHTIVDHHAEIINTL